MRLLPSITVLAGVVAAAPVHAQQYPARAIRVYIPFTAGSAGGNIAAELTAKSAPDGCVRLP